MAGSTISGSLAAAAARFTGLRHDSGYCWIYCCASVLEMESQSALKEAPGKSKLRQLASSVGNNPLFVPQYFSRSQGCRSPCRIEGCQNADQGSYYDNDQHIAITNIGWHRIEIGTG